MREKAKIAEIQQYVEELSSIMPADIGEYRDIRNKAACERYFEKIIEAVVDLAFIIIRDRGLRVPEEDKEAFDVIAAEKIIPAALAQKLKEAKGMRNLIAHEYGTVDDELVFHAITEELMRDIEAFLEATAVSQNTGKKT